MAATDRVGMAIKDRPEFKSKPKPLTMPEGETVLAAVKAMNEKNYGSVMIVDEGNKVIGVVTERDVMRKIVGSEKNAAEVKLSEIMTRDPRVAKEDDDLIDWLRIMSNERFRRLPVVDAEGRIKMVFTQGDFVSYTWPDLIYQAKELAKASVGRNYPVWMIGGGIMLYSILMVIVVASMS
ncbi:CBS domain-containing protein [Roseivivax halotolerans]|uniref:CBS domain-containing protein n=1 Tax=Roseivivax halotolerans TaxID=93684 RepID=A0A1I5XDP7_9RHOB|nr:MULTISPECIES: CBS domain-containing protein [Roseivivax]QFT63632.1 inosine 5'-monophosphate dehydrogenase [Roseivivax sp. THAF30]SFQ30092.1 CBS domain-containing protein [Roseivivax halotolerans]